MEHSCFSRFNNSPHFVLPFIICCGRNNSLLVSSEQYRWYCYSAFSVHKSYVFIAVLQKPKNGFGTFWSTCLKCVHAGLGSQTAACSVSKIIYESTPGGCERVACVDGASKINTALCSSEQLSATFCSFVWIAGLIKNPGAGNCPCPCTTSWLLFNMKQQPK